MKNIGIIGAGISGLVAAKTFLQQGFDVTVLEKSSGPGGVWQKIRSYAAVTTQTTRDEYAFSDFPMPGHYPLWPSGSQVETYLTNYAIHFDVLRHIRFNTVVEDMHFNGKEWEMNIVSPDGTRHKLCFFYVVVCTGTFHQPYLPSFKGIESFKAAGGEVLHSSAINDKQILENKHVAVVGFAKSATDIATLSADISKTCTLLYRRAQWKVPRFFANKINMRYLLFSRFSEAFFSAHKKTGFQKLLHTIGKPMVWLQWRGLEMLLKKQFSLKACGMVPGHKIDDQISCSLGVEPVGFYEKIKTGQINALQTEITHFNGREVILKSGQVIYPDLVVCGTGFRQTLPFLPVKYQNILLNERGTYSLYRNILHPDIPNLGFVGFNSSLFTTLTSEVAAHWLAAHVKGSMQLPPRNSMLDSMTRMDAWRHNTRPIAAEFSGLCVAPFNFQHIDELMNDMGLRTKASRNFIYEFFKPINPMDYKQLLQRNINNPSILKPGKEKVHVHSKM